MCTCVETKEEGAESTRTPLFTNNVTLNVRLNDKAVGRTKQVYCALSYK
jgi:hypothetical protein